MAEYKKYKGRDGETYILKRFPDGTWKYRKDEGIDYWRRVPKGYLTPTEEAELKKKKAKSSTPKVTKVEGIRTNKKGNRYLTVEYDGNTYNIFSNGTVWSTKTGKQITVPKNLKLLIPRYVPSLNSSKKSNSKKVASTNKSTIEVSGQNPTPSTSWENTYGVQETMGSNGNPIYQLNKRGRMGNLNWDMGRQGAINNPGTLTLLTTLGLNTNASTQEILLAMQRYAKDNNIAIDHINDANFVDGRWGTLTQSAWDALNHYINLSKNPATTNVIQVSNPYTRSAWDYSRGIDNLGFNNYAGLVNFVQGNANHGFARDLVNRFGTVDKWKLADIENALGISGRYGRGFLGSGDYTDMLNSMATWAGENDANYDNYWSGNILLNKNANTLTKDEINFLEKKYPLYFTPTAKRGMKLPSRNVVERFKEGKGLLLLFPFYKGQFKRFPFSKSKIFTDSTQKGPANDYVERAKERGEKRNKKITAMQEQLYKIGAFDKGTTYRMAVNGIRGKMTNAAILRARSKGYNVDLNTGKISKVSKPIAHNVMKATRNNVEKAKLVQLKQTPSLSSTLSSSPFITSMLNYVNNVKANMKQMGKTAQRQYENMFPVIKGYELPEDLKTIIAHKTKYDVTEPYLWIDRKAGKLLKLQRNKVLETIPIATGVNLTSDGYSWLPKTSDGKAIYDRSLTNSATPGGIFTLSTPMKGYYNQPSYHLIEAERGNNNAKRGLLIAEHTPASPDRVKKLNAGLKGITFGCIQLPNGRMSCANPGDSVYVSFSRPGNSFYEDPNDGLIKPRITNAPKLESGTTWGKQYNNVKVQYNYGY